LAGVAPPTSKPVKVALVITVVVVVAKSSAVSVSSLPALAVRERVAIRPSGLPVLKENGSATASGVPLSDTGCVAYDAQAGTEKP